MCASINNKNFNYKPAKSFITQNHLLILWKKTQGKLRENTENFISAQMWTPCKTFTMQETESQVQKQSHISTENQMSHHFGN